jgi:hypothetical protein
MFGPPVDGSQKDLGSHQNVSPPIGNQKRIEVSYWAEEMRNSIAASGWLSEPGGRQRFL